MFQHDANKEGNIEESNYSKRQILAQQIYHEVQEGYYQSSTEFFHSLYNEINNSSDHAVDIMLRNKRNYN